VTATISVGSGPTGVAVNSSTNTIYVTNTNASTVSVINGSSNTVTATISGLNGPEWLDTETVNVYSPNVSIPSCPPTVYVNSGSFSVEVLASQSYGSISSISVAFNGSTQTINANGGVVSFT